MPIHINAARRLAPVPQEERVSFTFDGTTYDGRSGEPVAVSLLAAGIRIFQTMPDSGDARGGFCFEGRCADCLMIVDGLSGVRTCTTRLVDGMIVETQHGHGRPVPGTTK